MPEARRRSVVRRAVRERAKGCCEYCRSPDDCSPAPFHVEHVFPETLDGSDDLENLAWACGGCNGFKGVAVEALDPISGELTPLFHPRRQIWGDHFSWGADPLFCEGITAVGRATISRLHLNRSEILTLRQLLALAERHPPDVS